MEFCSSEESLPAAQQFRDDDGSPPEKQSEVDEAENPEPPLSPGLLAELSLSSYTPMRITRRMASMRESFTRDLGITVREPEKIPGETPAARKTGKRSAGRSAARSGWTKSSIIVKESEEIVARTGSRGKQKKGVNEVKIRGKKKGLKKPGRRKVAIEELGDETEEGGEDVSSGVTEGEPAEKMKLQPQRAKLKSPGVGWVMCDDCRKWRCISSDLADAIEASDVKWTCKENPNMKFADCSVPQEKTNAEINAELNISEISTSEGDDIDAAVSSKSRASWSQIQHNIFHHRHPKELDDDDTLICHCKASADGLGCGEDCLNRMMNVECSPDTCPCGEHCSNQQFGKRMYAKFELIRCGKKGFGLRAMQPIPKGSFIIEYVGEVLDMRAFEVRQKEYTRQGQKHFYFMTLNSSEVIDACRKGNLGRFINHSCEPNCATEKWCVNGEICIGLFAIRDLKKNEEITFNYNFERLYGAAARRCHCGSATCTGFIGETPKPGDVVQSDSEDDLEPVMLKEEESGDENVVDTETPQEGMEVCTTPPEETKVEPPEPEPEAEPEQLEPAPEPVPEPVPELPVVLKPKLPAAVADAKSCRVKVKRAKAGGRPKKAAVSRAFKPMTCRTSRTEVEDKLDRLLNPEGGLSKKKDTPKQYLKLLVISTASGDASSEGTSCNMRELSLLLDAMLKTSSRTILNEVIQKNGLQLLHNLLKQSRKSFTKIPILRKLLKVLELLAERKILSSKEMTSTPPRNGMESFVKSIYELTRHEDMEVQLISRRFQKNWIPGMFDIFTNDKMSGNQFAHKYWGPDRFSQKRELFRSDQRPQRPAFNEHEERHPRPQTNELRHHSSEHSSDHQERAHLKPQNSGDHHDQRPLQKPQPRHSGDERPHHQHDERPQFRASGDRLADERPSFRAPSEHHHREERPHFRHCGDHRHDERSQLRPSSDHQFRPSSGEHHRDLKRLGDHHPDERPGRKPESEQEKKRRKKSSRWDEMPSMASSSGASSQQVHSQEMMMRDKSTTPTTAIVEAMEPEPPGYSSKVSPVNCRRELENHRRAPPESSAHHHHRESSSYHHPGSSSDWRPLEHQKADRSETWRALEPPGPSPSEACYRRPLEQQRADHRRPEKFDRPGSSEGYYRMPLEHHHPQQQLDYLGSSSSSDAYYQRPLEQQQQPHHRPGSSEALHCRRAGEQQESPPPPPPGAPTTTHRTGTVENFPQHDYDEAMDVSAPGLSPQEQFYSSGAPPVSSSYRRPVENHHYQQQQQPEYDSSAGYRASRSNQWHRNYTGSGYRPTQSAAAVASAYYQQQQQGYQPSYQQSYQEAAAPAAAPGVRSHYSSIDQQSYHQNSSGTGGSYYHSQQQHQQQTLEYHALGYSQRQQQHASVPPPPGCYTPPGAVVMHQHVSGYSASLPPPPPPPPLPLPLPLQLPLPPRDEEPPVPGL